MDREDENFMKTVLSGRDMSCGTAGILPRERFERDGARSAARTRKAGPSLQPGSVISEGANKERAVLDNFAGCGGSVRVIAYLNRCGCGQNCTPKF